MNGIRMSKQRTHARNWMCGLACVAVVVTAASTALANDYYVDVAWTGTESGSQIEPYNTIGEAVAAANTTNAINKIYIAAGWYGDVANSGQEDYSEGGGADGGIQVTQRTYFYGGYAGWDGDGATAADFDWTPASRAPRSTLVDLQSASSRALYFNCSVQSQIVGLLDGLTFQNANHTANGGAVGGASLGYGRFAINDCLFTNNVTIGAGGAVSISVSYETHTIKMSDFIDNVAAHGGAIRSSGGYVTIEDCLFQRNSVTGAGGAINFDGSNGPQQNVRRCRFEGNIAGGSGGAFFTTDPRVVVEQSSFINNAAPIGAAAGGYTYHTGPISLQNCLVTGNTGSYALYVRGYRMYGAYSLDVVHSTVVGNPDGGIYCRDETTTARPGRVINSIVANNGQYGIYNVDRGYILANNNVTNNTLGDYYNCTPDAASISADSRFIDAASGDYRLMAGSPCIDAGTNLAVTVDLDGVGRPTRYGYDIGCYEEKALPVLANRTPIAEGISAEPRAEFTYEDPLAPTYVFFVLDTTDCGTEALNAWTRVVAAGEQTQGVIFGALFEGLTPETVYCYRCMASNAYDQVWGELAYFRTAAAGGATRRWTGGGGNALASNANNWQNGLVPGAADYVVLDNSSAAITWDAGVNNLPDTVARWTQLEAYTGTVTFRTVYPGQGGFTNFLVTGDAILANGTWAHAQNTASQTYRLAVEVAGDLGINAAAKISAANLGFYNAGPGRQPVFTGGGAAHGGRGGEQTAGYGSTNVYGSIFAPLDLGSGGSSPVCYGGGAVRLVVGGAFTHGGLIDVNAGSVNGAGGSVFITAGRLTGAGTMQASNPNSSNYASGGGGRIAIILTHPDATFDAFDGVVRANTIHSTVDRRGAAGTVYLQTAAQGSGGGTLVIDNQAQVPTHFTTLPPNDGISRACSLELTTTGRLRVNRDIALRDLTLASGASLDLAGKQVVVDRALTVAGITGYKVGSYPASDFGSEVVDTADPASGAIIIPAIGTMVLLQ